MAQPDVIHANDWWRPGLGIDPARYLLKPGTVTGPGKHTAGQWAHARPYISNGSTIFVFPVGAEGFSDQGEATLGLHKYIGGLQADGVVVHREDSKITLTGTFPGINSVQNRIDCRNMLHSIPQGPGLTLWVPGVFAQEQYVLAESWDFTHDKDDRTHSIDYTITFVRIGTKRKVKNPSGEIPPPQPIIKTKPRGKPHRIYTVKANVRTLRAIAKRVYHNPYAWPHLVTQNEGQLNRWKKNHPNIPGYKIPTYRWPLGTKFRY